MSVPIRQPRSGGAAVMALLLAWAALLTLAVAWPSLSGSPTPGDDFTRNTVRLSLLFYAAALTLMMTTGRVRLARWCWTLAWAALVIHLGMAFHHYHGWSHADAVRRTREVSGFGEGVYVSYLLALAWTVDVAAWWLRPAWRARRSPWFGRVLHGFMLFVVFNATIVYGTGAIRWVGTALFAWLVLAAAIRQLTRR